MTRNRHNPKEKPDNTEKRPSPFFFENGFCRGMETRHGFMIYNQNDFIGKTLELYGEWAFSEIKLLSMLIKPGYVVIDVGANIGTHTLSMAKMVGPDGFVFSLEPQRIAFEFLSANIILNNLVNVFPIHAGACDKPGEILVPVIDPTNPANSGSFAIEDHKFGDEVRLITLDSLGLARCNLIKVDVEGMEKKVIDGARQTILKHRPIMFIENNVEEKSEEMIKTLRELNYSLWWFFSEYFDQSFHPDYDLICLPKEWNSNVEGYEPVLDDKDIGTLAYERSKSQQ